MNPTQREKVPCKAVLAMPSGLIQSKMLAAELWSRLYVDVRAAIQAALLLNGGASVALLAFLGNLAIGQQTKGITGNFGTFKGAFVCFGIGVMLAASSNVVAFPIQNVALAHPKEPKAGLVADSD
jgi:hypothetical protein